ncbi:hypothetical protein [Actinopolymorpha sp. B9G3]|uniref:hypothetical protein n=1 Tax=Actinopolymorpha sp. B9G3 TaxID=3158970 RepID=UPI0032D94CE2
MPSLPVLEPWQRFGGWPSERISEPGPFHTDEVLDETEEIRARAGHRPAYLSVAETFELPQHDIAVPTQLSLQDFLLGRYP